MALDERRELATVAPNQHGWRRRDDLDDPDAVDGEVPRAHRRSSRAVHEVDHFDSTGVDNGVLHLPLSTTPLVGGISDVKRIFAADERARRCRRRVRLQLRPRQVLEKVRPG
jgi:hypothetical protein